MYRSCCAILFCFFFSSRRRHTRLQGDWSSDVCSSDLAIAMVGIHIGLNLEDEGAHPRLGRVDLAQIGFLRPGRRRETAQRSEEHTSELQSPCNLVCRLLLEKKNNRRAPDQLALGISDA